MRITKRLLDKANLESPTTIRGAAILLGLALSILIQSGVLVISEPWTATVVACAVACLFPGLLLSTFFPAEDFPSPLVRLPVAFVLGLGLLLLPAVLLLVFHGSLNMLASFSIAVQVALVGFYLWRLKKQRHLPHRLLNLLPVGSQANPFLLFTFLISIVVTLYLFISTASVHAYGDRWPYQAYVRQYLDEPFLASTDAQYGTSFNNHRVMFDGWLVLLAFLSKISGVTPLEQHSIYLPPVLMIISICAFYSLARVLFKRQEIAMLATLVQMIYHLSSVSSEVAGGLPGGMAGSGRSFMARLIEDKTVAWLILLPVATMFMLRYFSTRKGSYLAAFVLAIAALALTHPLGPVWFGLSCGAFALIHLLFNRNKETLAGFVIIALPILLAASLPWLQRQITFSTSARPFEAERIDIVANWWYIDTLRFIQHPMIILSLLLTPFLLIYIRKSLAAQFIFSNMVIPLALVSNPLTASLLLKLMTWGGTLRLLWILPVALTISFFLYKGIRLIQTRLTKSSCSVHQRILRQLAPVLVIMLLVIAFKDDLRENMYYLQRIEVQTISEDEKEILRYLADCLSNDQVIMAEPHVVGRHLPAYVGKAIVLHPQGWRCPGCPEDLEYFYSANYVDETVLNILNRHHIGYLIIETDHRLVAQFEHLPSMFSRVYQNDTYALYQPTSELQPNHVVIGNSYLSHGDWDKAIAAYEAALVLDPGDYLAHFGLGQVHQAQGRMEDAEVAYLEAVNVDSHNGSAHASLAQVYTAQGKIPQAIEAYEAALQDCPQCSSIHVSLADAYFTQGRVAEAMAEYKNSIGFTHDQAQGHLDLGYLLLSKGLYDQATTAFEQAFLASDGYILGDSWRGLADIYQAKGETEAAIAAYKKATKMQTSPENFGAHMVLGYLYQRQGLTETAINLYQRAAKIRPSRAWPHLALAALYVQEDNFEEAFAAYEQAIASEPDNITAYLGPAEIYKAQQDVNKLKTLYQEVLQKFPNSVEPYISLGDLYVAEGNIQQAIASYQQAIVIAPEKVAGYERLGQLYEAQGDREQAIGMYREAIRQAPNSRSSHLALLRLYMATDRLEEACIVARQAMILKPGDMSTYLLLGQVYERQGQMEEAEILYQRLGSMFPDSPQPHLTLAKLYFEEGKLDEAVRAYEQALAVAPDPDEVRRTVEQFIGTCEECPKIVPKPSK